ncbi:MAG TPA: gluconate kinase, partial [Pseudonocardiaceae bacterium]|nr:gluconate kinase [Pseudonocardiaceae bacterium]
GIAVRETHTGAVFLIGDRAYKLKKPVNMGFLDFTTRERRLAACDREVELNRRLASDVYLGVADVSGVDGSLCDHLVVMRRMPASRRLATMVRVANHYRRTSPVSPG